jgi:hypothetical protein
VWFLVVVMVDVRGRAVDESASGNFCQYCFALDANEMRSIDCRKRPENILHNLAAARPQPLLLAVIIAV